MLTIEDLASDLATLDTLAKEVTVADLRRLTNEMVNQMLDMIAEATDADVVFVPEDPEANDTFAINLEEVHLAWTLGHVIVHTTSSAEESAALASELARGVTPTGRSRYEVPWETVSTVAQCRHRLEESRRMRLASLDMWPDEPHLEHCYQPVKSWPTLNPVMRFLLGLTHDHSHLGQIQDIVKQAEAARKQYERTSYT